MGSAVTRVGAVVAAAVVVALTLGTAGAPAASWCGTPSTADRPPAVAGPTIRVVYAIPADAVDHVADRAPAISTDVDAIGAWWQAQDAEREPRFDVTPFSCGLQMDLLVLRLGECAEALRTDIRRLEQIQDAAEVAGGLSPWITFLVYYDGPTDDDAVCGQGRGAAGSAGIAIVYLQACGGVSTATVATHELLHALGALPGFGAPHACPGDPGHPCDSTADILYPYTSGLQLGSFALDVGHDDYYGHSGNWPDIQRSPWLRLVHQQRPLAVTVTGVGSVASDVPGLVCAARCSTQWDLGAELSLEASPAAGQRFVRWTGACTGEVTFCDLTVEDATSVTARFAPASVRLVVSLRGKGVVRGAGTACRAGRCVRQTPSYTRLTLTARPAAGWRFAGWTGSCTGLRPRCALPMEKASGVGARFVRR